MYVAKILTFKAICAIYSKPKKYNIFNYFMKPTNYYKNSSFVSKCYLFKFLGKG